MKLNLVHSRTNHQKAPPEAFASCAADTDRDKCPSKSEPQEFVSAAQRDKLRVG